MKRAFDLLISLCLIPFLFMPMLVIAAMIRLSSGVPVLYWSDRVGKGNAIFKMPKFRTMKLNTPVVATHLLEGPEKYLIPMGSLLRKLSLDELPQIWSVISGDMSLVGPRPALYNQDDLIKLRTMRGIHELVPGVTGWAQIHGRDDLPIPVKMEYDEYYLKHRSLLLDLKILFMTVVKVIRREGVKH